MATTAISIEEYLRTVPDPDVEYVDGALKERPMVFSIHGRLQAEIGAWFLNHRKEWKIACGVEIRTRVSSARVRLPDVIVDRAYAWPEVLIEPPLIVIEILSPSDTAIELEEKCDDYSAMGIPNIWIINPERRTGRVWQAGEWSNTQRFTVVGTEIYLDLPKLFEQLNSFENSPENDPA